ncbi:MAG: VOC family protein [Clostridia bacterium]|nr:VOC family protein [Clostridia bacterium]
MKLEKVHHVAIICGDYEKAKHFYVDLLEFEMIDEHIRPARNDRIMNLRCGDQQIELFIMPDAPARLTFPEGRGLRHLAFSVGDVDAMAAQLAAKGIETQPVRIDPYTGEKMTFFFDPDGLPIEIRE